MAPNLCNQVDKDVGGVYSMEATQVEFEQVRETSRCLKCQRVYSARPEYQSRFPNGNYICTLPIAMNKSLLR